MNTPKWIRDANRVKSNFKKLGDKWVTKEQCQILFPCYYEEKKLATITDIVKVLGVCMILVNDTYAVLSVNAMIEFTPSEINTTEIDNEKYYQMVFDPGSIVIDNIKIVKQDTLPYYIYDVFISKGKIPWFMNYTDVCKLFDTAKEYADANVGSNPEIIQLLVSLIARDKKDRTLYFRQIVKDKIQQGNDVVFIPMKSIDYGATNTVTKLGGNYMSIGIVSALNNPSDKVENIESILRY